MTFKHYIFDLDGTIVNTKDIHNKVFSDTLKHFELPPIHPNHADVFEGRSSKDKVKSYNTMYEVKIDEEPFLKEKQRRSVEALNRQEYFDIDIFTIFKTLSRTREISIATNCTLESAQIILQKMQLSFFINRIGHNLSGKPKPAPDIYRMCIDAADIPEKDTVVFEDNDKGIEAATKASDDLCIIRVTGPDQLKKLFL